MTLVSTVVGTVIAVLTFVLGLSDRTEPAPPTSADPVLGVITGDLSSRPSKAGESSLGDVIADAQLWYTQDAGADIALVNAGGIRGSLLYGASADGEAPGQVTASECAAVQPFRGKPLVTITLTGGQVRQALEQQFAGYLHQTETRILQVSEGLSYQIDVMAPLGSRISNLILHNEPVHWSTDYRVTVNSFLLAGGDGFTTFTEGRRPASARGADYDALAAYLSRGEPVAPGRQDRIRLA